MTRKNNSSATSIIFPRIHHFCIFLFKVKKLKHLTETILKWQLFMILFQRICIFLPNHLRSHVALWTYEILDKLTKEAVNEENILNQNIEKNDFLVLIKQSILIDGNVIRCKIWPTTPQFTLPLLLDLNTRNYEHLENDTVMITRLKFNHTLSYLINFVLRYFFFVN